MVAAAGIPVVEVPFVSVGGGIGSFVTTDYLRIAGVPKRRTSASWATTTPRGPTYEYLTRNSQIPRQERLRSDSASTPDCIWGFPSYAVREALAGQGARREGQAALERADRARLRRLLDARAPGRRSAPWRRKPQRIGYFDCFVKGLVRMIAQARRRRLLHDPHARRRARSSTKRIAYRSRYVHIAVGYPGLKFLDDLQEYRQKYDDYTHVVNAYEPHEHIYEELKRKPGTVLVRGGGIVASRILQRLIDDRDHHGAQTQIIHLFRTYVDSSHGPSIFMRRKGRDGWAYQGFNYPKSVWGGQLQEPHAQARGRGPRRAVQDHRRHEHPGAASCGRSSWPAGAARAGTRPMTGVVDSVVPADGRRHAHPRQDQGRRCSRSPANYIIDGTGLEADIAEHRLLADLLEHSGAGRNPLGRLDVERTFEVRGTRSGDGRMYASGTATLGGYFPGVDTFLGLQIAAQEIADDLARQGFGKRIGPVRSTTQWLKWARGKKI